MNIVHDDNSDDDDDLVRCSESLSEVKPRSKDQELHTKVSAVVEATTKVLAKMMMVMMVVIC